MFSDAVVMQHGGPVAVKPYHIKYDMHIVQQNVYVYKFITVCTDRLLVPDVCDLSLSQLIGSQGFAFPVLCLKLPLSEPM